MLLAANYLQDPTAILGDGDSHASAENFLAWDELEYPMIWLVINRHFIVAIGRVRSGTTGGFECIEKRIQLQDHDNSTSSHVPSTETSPFTSIS
jgi:hypothetical protein